jgi:ATP-dependent DNA helicase DinG
MQHYNSDCPKDMKEHLIGLFKQSANIDLTAATDLTANTKRQICVPARCSEHCPKKSRCRYQKFIKEAIDPSIDIQVVNHNYLIADAILKSEGKRLLIPNYQITIIDEAHKLLSAARSMYGAELSFNDVRNMLEYLENLKFCTRSSAVSIAEIVKKLRTENRRLFNHLDKFVPDDEDDEKERYRVEFDDTATRHLRNIRDIADRLYEQLSVSLVLERHEYRKDCLLWEISKICAQADVFTQHKNHICWLEEGTDFNLSLHSVPKDVDKRLYNHFWSKGIPTVLTSGTLSAGGDFSHIKRTLGLEPLQNRITEVSKPSPFNHQQNALLYISESVPFPDNKNEAYIKSVTDEVEKLVYASHGRAAVLFTSYNTMGRVYSALSERKIPFPLLRLERKSSDAIEKFKQSENGVLFASGALWEGIDIPGDSLSMLIIVKLPFQVPDPISEYEQSMYSSLLEYKIRVIIPEMLIKLKQGYGRLLRTETDTGCVAILDSRVNSTGAYRKWLIDTLPKSRVTSCINVVKKFFRAVKSAAYFSLKRK